MLDTDWARLRTLRATQPTLSDVYLMLKYLVQLSGPWKRPATACIQQVKSWNRKVAMWLHGEGNSKLPWRKAGQPSHPVDVVDSVQ